MVKRVGFAARYMRFIAVRRDKACA